MSKKNVSLVGLLMAFVLVVSPFTSVLPLRRHLAEAPKGPSDSVDSSGEK